MVLVTIIVPCRNEREHIEDFLTSIARQEGSDFELEVIVADGMSDDGTRSILEALCARYSNIKMIDNPKGIVSAGLNAAICVASGDIIVRMDVHTRYADDYVAECVRALRDSHAKCVGGPWRATGQTVRQIAIADAFQSPIASGAAASRKINYSGPCDTVYLGCWRKADLISIGGFDETLVRNQDDELNLRFVKNGGTIWQSAAIKSDYFPRKSYRALFRQFSQYGYWKVAVAKKHGQHAAIRHLLPFIFLCSSLLLIVGCVLSRDLLAIAAIHFGGYIAAVIVGAMFASRRKAPLSILLVAIAISVMHIGYGMGYAMGLIDFSMRSGRRSSSMSELTR